jgi:mono/diheme cytochrome c family protein
MSKHKAGKKDPSRSVASRYGGLLLVGGAVLLFLGIATVDLWWPSGVKNPMATVPAAEVARGEVLYRENCQACHGVAAQGENPLQPMGGTKPTGGYLAPALNPRGHAHHHPPDVLFSYLRNGSPAADSPMRSFREKLSEADMHAVLGYIWSLWPQAMQEAYARTHSH